MSIRSCNDGKLSCTVNTACKPPLCGFRQIGVATF